MRPRNPLKNIFKNGAFLLVLTLVVPAMAAAGTEPQPRYGWEDKLKRGSLNILTSPVEIARQIQLTTEEDHMLKGWTLGLVTGFGYGFMRFGAGVIDLFTFPFNFPDEDKGPLIEPEYVWEKPGVKYA